MPYQGVAFFFVLGVGIATAALMYFLREAERQEQPHENARTTGYSGYDNDVPRQGWQRNDTSNSSQRRRRRKITSGSTAAPVCAVCIDEMMAGGPPCKELRCGHTFHVRCIDRWAESKRECPQCRQWF